jgi:hypothetical protein
MGKIINLLFDIFHSTKYFHAYLYAIACHFCVGCFTHPNPIKIFMVGYLEYDYATVIFIDFSMH